MAAKKATSTKAKKPKAGTRAKKPAKKTTKRASATSRSNGLDRSVDHFRKSLERSVTLSRERLQDVVDDAVKRGRITRGDAEKMLSELVNKGRRQTDSLLKELERLVKQVRKEVSGRGKKRR
jgi:polyhydroxyalkanoate synthesis regulator phasin